MIASYLLDEAVHDLLLSGLVEGDGELVVLDRADGAVAEFLVEDAVAGVEATNPAQLGAAHRHRDTLDEARAARAEIGIPRGAWPFTPPAAQARAHPQRDTAA